MPMKWSLKFRSEQKKREKEKRTGVTRKSLEKLKAHGLSLYDFSAKLLNQTPAESPSALLPTPTIKSIPTVTCPKCGKETISLTFQFIWPDSL